MPRWIFLWTRERWPHPGNVLLHETDMGEIEIAVRGPANGGAPGPVARLTMPLEQLALMHGAIGNYLQRNGK